MIEVYKNLFVGTMQDYEKIKEESGWYVVQACKEPYHRQALGYKTIAAPKNHPEYLFAERDNRLILNLVDVDVGKSRFIPNEIIEKALKYIDTTLKCGGKVLVHCNQGFSRGPSIALAYMIKHTDTFKDAADFEDVEKKFINLYTHYSPAGIREKVRELYSK